MRTLHHPCNWWLILRHSLFLALLLLWPRLTATAVTFTNDTAIPSYDTNYDGTDIVVTNCTLTVDGPHSFASLQVLNGGNLTHTYAPGGVVNTFFTVTNEPQVLSLTNAATLANSNVYSVSIVVQDLSGQITYTNALDYMFVPVSNNMTILLLTPNSAIAEGSTNLVSYQYYTSVAAGLSLIVTGDVTVAQGGTIVADGKGYGGGVGTGHGNSSGSPQTGSGAGHGGSGGQGGSGSGVAGGTPYDVIQQPVMLGSGGGVGQGGVGAAGGGGINLVIGGTMRVDGAVTAHGADALNDRAGGGAGGSIWLTAQSFAGTGLISANGGAGEPSQGGGGAGGRIALWYGTASFPGTKAARGGNGYVRGGAGTIYSRAQSQPTGQLLVDNGGQTGATTTLSTGEPLDLTVQGGATILLLTSQTVGNLLIGSNAWITPANQQLTVTSNATIQAGGGVSADSAGNAPGYGTGAGSGSSSPNGYIGGGGGYGGYGAAGGTPAYYYAFGGITHGSVTSPTDLGAGGGSYYSYCIGGYGGGAVHLNVTGTLWLDGEISADGGLGVTAGGGGGSGGSVWLSAGTLTGAGTISANGGMGNGSGLAGGGGGGGGRIAVNYAMNLFFGAMSARGGSGTGVGGAGTIYTKANSASWGLVLADNGGQAGTNTSWSSSGTIDLTVKGGAVVSPPTSQQIGTLLVASNGWLSIASQTLTVSGNATVQAGGGIIADGTGYASNLGAGAGKYSNSPNGYIGGGGAYGGYGAAGGAPSTYPANGGSPYGSVTAPTALGSGGGGFINTSGPITAGGSGGGAINLNVTGVLQADGRISAAGLPGAGASGGGGSGGSIYLTVGTLAGSGVISANGGMGNYLGGGGGGGRIAIQYGVYEFSGLVSAYGGGGYAIGGAGTIYTKANSQSSGLVTLDNGGQSGTNSSCPTGTVDLTVKGGAVLSTLYSPTTIGTLLVASNGWINAVASGYSLTVSGNATIQAGGGIIADGTGYAGGLGTGAGRSSGSSSGGGGGGGYGGYGAAGSAVSGYSGSGGTIYGSATSPNSLGSGGGGSYSGPVGGAGGGTILLTVSGALEVDGTISARGLAGVGASAGGGSGGSITLSVGTLAGSGLISANGGAGNALGGGGGGGRVAIGYTAANTFSGLVSAYGGGGYGVGGAGTVCILRLVTGASGVSITVDNGGQSGTNTGWPSVVAGAADLTLRNGAWLAMPTSYQSTGNLLIGSNGWIFVSGSAGLSPQTLAVYGNATIQAGGGIIADSGGYSYLNGGTGPGAGGYVSSSSGGGGFGGNGGAGGGSTYAYGGHAFGLVTQGGPGSAGGTSGSSFVGGSGGGGISLNVTGVLDLEGRISSAGGPGVTWNAGGGAGGGIALTVGTLAGSGVIAANGGAGNGLGGGGGGGRISITYTANTFGGVMTAYGGSGYNRGGAGTIYTKARSSSWGQVLADNGGQAGATTGWASTSTFDLTATGGAVIAPPSATFGNLTVTSNAWISVSNQVLTVTGTATIQAGGGIIADAAGYAARSGPGAGLASSSSSGYFGGGGGYGGYGAAGGAPPGYSAFGGSPYGSFTTPTAFGSGGGSYLSSTPPGSAGGAAICMNVTGALLVNGRISANGGTATAQGAGGGAGGSVWLTAGTLAGTGSITANGGAGNGLGSGGGGGRIALQYGANAFEGVVSAYGGGGAAWGGAGTIYSQANSQAMGLVLLDNGGNAGTNTPVPYLAPFDLTIRGGAVANPAGGPTPWLQLSNLVVNSSGTLTCLPIQADLVVSVLGNATIDAGGLITVDGKGFSTSAGPGAGHSTSYVGSGAGYGGNGGASSTSPGGLTYGSAQQPVDRGSGGGSGWQGGTGGGEGGGALRLSVGGSLTVNGRISAEGNAASQDGGGGGSGGSIWLMVGALAGTGSIAADGGAGQLYYGGGGGGGRIAIYTPVSAFSGLVSVTGGSGFMPGQSGSIYSSSSVPPPQVVSADPTGPVNYGVTYFHFGFSSMINPASVSTATVSLTAPGEVAVSNLLIYAMNPFNFQVTFPQQIAQGNYVFTIGPQVFDLLGQPMPQAYTNSFSIVWSAIQGAVTDTNGQPVAGVVLQPDGGVPSTTTDTNGLYLLSVPPTVPVTVTPSAVGLTFVPSSRTYAGVSGTISNENYLAVTTVAPALTTQVQSNSLALNWYGISGVSYQPLCSTNLVDWVPYNSALPGTNGPLQLIVPMDASPMMFFRLGASH
jgi:hypothetical protein